MEKEISGTHAYLERQASKRRRRRCIDGRPVVDAQLQPEDPEGFQMLGGTLHPIVVTVINRNAYLDENFVRTSISLLREKGLTPGIHRGNPVHGEGKSGCGFADYLIEIIEKAKNNQEEITARILKINPDVVPLITAAYIPLRKFNPHSHILITGEKLIQSAESAGAESQTVEGEHLEEIMYINSQRDVTFDTQAANKAGWQAFNLDLGEAIDESRVLEDEIKDELSEGLSLILGIATEMVLVEDKGKDPLQVKIHS